MPSICLLADAAPHFCRLAGHVISVWEVQAQLSECWQSGDTLSSPRFGGFFSNLNDMIIDGWFLSVARLHDPARTNGDPNLSVNFLLEHPELASCTKSRLEQLTPQMETFATFVRQPRNKLLAHNDLKSMVSISNLGEFPQGRDCEYIENLRGFAGVISQDVLNEPFVYGLAANDVVAVVSVLRHGLSRIDPE